MGDVPIDLVEDTVLDALFKNYIEPKPEPHCRPKTHHSKCITDAGDNASARKK